MKKYLLNTIKKMEEDGYDFKESPAIFRWSYEERPDISFDLLIQKDVIDVNLMPSDLSIMH